MSGELRYALSPNNVFPFSKHYFAFFWTNRWLEKIDKQKCSTRSDGYVQNFIQNIRKQKLLSNSNKTYFFLPQIFSSNIGSLSQMSPLRRLSMQLVQFWKPILLTAEKSFLILLQVWIWWVLNIDFFVPITASTTTQIIIQHHSINAL